MKPDYRRLEQHIAEILVATQFAHWVEQDGDLTAEQAKTAPERARRYYRGETDNPKIDWNQVRFRSIINCQLHYIMQQVMAEME